VRADSPLTLALIGTMSVHLLLFTATDAMSTLTRHLPEPAPRFELVDIDEPEPPPPPRALPAPPPPDKTLDPTPIDRPTPPHPTPQVHTSASHPPVDTPPTPTPPTSDTPPVPGALGADGVDRGWSNDEGTAGPRDAHGTHAAGTGSGLGSAGGTGTGSAPAPPAPPSIATIKRRALPKGDYGVLEAGKSYPDEARRLGIEGDLRVRLVVDTTGHVTSATLLGHLGHGLDELALKQARAIEFDPAIDTDDQPTTSVVVWSFHFTLPK
jgi:TonB family protein